MCEKCGKSELYLGVKLRHPYVGVFENNRLREVRRFNRRPLEDTWCLMHVKSYIKVVLATLS